MAVGSFFAMKELEKIVVVVPKSEHGRAAAALEPMYPCDRIEFSEGGRRRQESVYMGLQRLTRYRPRYVLIHDAARPWVSKSVIRRVLDALPTHGACAPVIPAADALKHINEQGFITSHLNRATTLAVQTPQGFSFNEILEAHLKAANDGIPYIDDTEIFNRYIGNVYTVVGEPENRKITFPHDLPGFSIPVREGEQSR